MIDFRLRGMSTASERRLPQADVYRIEGPVLLAPDGRPIAKHSGGSWWAADVCYTALYTHSRCLVHFENADSKGPTHGPYDYLLLADGMVRGGENPPELLATLIDSLGMWAYRRNGELWQRLLIASVSD